MRLVGLKNHFKFYLILTVLATVSVFGNFLSIRRFWGSCRLSTPPQEEFGEWPGGLCCLLCPGELSGMLLGRPTRECVPCFQTFTCSFPCKLSVSWVIELVCSPGPYKLAAYKRALAPSQGSLQLPTDPAWKVNLEETQMS